MRKKDLIQLGVTGVLLVVLILVWANASVKLRRPLRKPGYVLSGLGVSVPSPVSRMNNPAGNNLYDLLEQQAKSIVLKRDPFTASPIISEKSLRSELSLTGILWDKANPLAIINGNVVKKGQRVGNKAVMDIRQDRVILSDGQILSEIRLEH
jgi:hypothetical protein